VSVLLVTAQVRQPIGGEKRFEIVADPGGYRALAVDGPGKHGAAVDFLGQAGEFGGVAGLRAWKPS